MKQTAGDSVVGSQGDKRPSLLFHVEQLKGPGCDDMMMWRILWDCMDGLEHEYIRDVLEVKPERLD